MIDCNDYLLTSPASCPYPVIYDGLGRLKTAHEEISYPGAATRTHHYSYGYDMRSQLTSANIDAGTWQFGFTYDKDGNINQQTLNSTDTNYSYQDSNSTDIMTAAGDIDLSWDPNGRLETKDDYTFIYNGDGKLREVLDVNSNPLIKLKYDPMGNRVYKWSYNAGSPIGRKIKGEKLKVSGTFFL